MLKSHQNARIVVNVEPKIESSWLTILKEEFSSSYFSELMEFLIEEKKKIVVYPSDKDIFRAFDLTPFNDVKIVILGQDPYHGPNQAQGLSFSVRDGVKFPPSLRNIFQELSSDAQISIPQNGDLSSWAQQGVLLLNAALTVRHKSAGSHQKKGWETFTDACISKLSEKREHLVFLLWGNYARAKKALINSEKHLILEAPHPSPFSAHTGFFGCRHFSKANRYLEEHGVQPIDWASIQ